MQYVESFKSSKKRNSSGLTNSQREEQKMLYQAIKNSLVEQKNSNANLSDIQEMPVYYPTEQEFREPLEYMD